MMEYFTKVNIDKNEEKIYLDLDFYHKLPLDDKIYSLWVFIKQSDKNYDAEYQTLIDTIEKKHQAIYIANKNVDGWNEFYFYAPSEKLFSTTVNECLKDFHMSYECGSHKDYKFKVYLENLYPSELEFHQIESRKIIHELEQEGDELNVMHDVDHYAFFQTQANLTRYIDNVEKLGFTLKQHVLQDESDFAYGAILSKKHTVTLEVVENEISDLLEKILEEHGYYEGWSTTLRDNSN